MADKRSKPVNVPESEIARQATDALGGYVYQLDHTVMTWLTLGDDEALHIEFAEDIAKSNDAKLDLTQIKRVAANITLWSSSIGSTIRPCGAQMPLQTVPASLPCWTASAATVFARSLWRALIGRLSGVLDGLAAKSVAPPDDVSHRR
jgi:hypothetical protein